MIPFTFIYHEKECNGNYLPSERGKGWLKVIFFEHSAIIMPTLIQRKNLRKVWVQTINAGEAVWPHDLIQAIGEAIEMTQLDSR